MMKSVALYARVSSEQQAQRATIESQLAALRERAAGDGHVVLPADTYVDDGYSGAVLVRPALERLRDRAAEGRLDIVYVHDPDRLARRYAYQVLLLEELSREGVSVVFLSGPSGRNAEDELLISVQGVIAEYERTKILERCRRGKVHKARTGVVNALSAAPYGYLYVRKTDSQPASYQVLLHESKVVRLVFDWFVSDQVSLGEIVRRLHKQQVLTRTGRTRWERSTVWAILRNPAYMGQAAYGKTESVVRGPSLRPRRGASPIPRHAKSTSRDRPQAEWISIPVPALVSADVFAAAQEQLDRNRGMAAEHRGNRYLLQGLTVCSMCRYAYYGKHASQKSSAGRRVGYSYYRCRGSDGYRFATGRVCRNAYVRVEQLDEYVWESVCQVLQEPQRLLAEWTRRGTEDGSARELRTHRDEVKRLLAEQEKTLRRLLDAYEAGAMNVSELTSRTERIRTRIRTAQADLENAETDLTETVELAAIVGRLNDFAAQVRAGLHRLDWQARRQLIRTLVSRIEIDESSATVVYRVPGTSPAVSAPGAHTLTPAPLFSPVLGASRLG